jgi:hypothetical protein
MPRWVVVLVACVAVSVGVTVYVSGGSSGDARRVVATETGGSEGIVAPENGQAGQGLDTAGMKLDPRVPVCEQVSGDRFCVSGQAALDLDEAMQVFEAQGPAAAMKLLETKLSEGASWVRECHQMIHIIGHEAARLYPIREVVAVDNRMCQDGYLDGAMEGFADYSDEQEFWDGISVMCDPMIENGDRWKASSCAHSVGHAIAFRGVGNYREAVKYCDAIAETLRDACGGGAIMGIVNPVEGSAVSDLGLPKYSTLDPKIIDATCTGIEQIYASVCLSILWTMYPDTWEAQVLLDRLLGLCPKSLDVDRCFDGYGSAVYQKNLPTADERGESAEEVYSAAEPLLERCYKLPKDGVGGCVQGVTYSAIWWYATVHSSVEGYISMCPVVKEPWRERCAGSEREVSSGYSEGGVDPQQEWGEQG